MKYEHLMGETVTCNKVGTVNLSLEDDGLVSSSVGSDLTIIPSGLSEELEVWLTTDWGRV